MWISEVAKDLVTAFTMIKAAKIMDSDHDIIIASINIGDLIPNNWSHTSLDNREDISKEKRLCIDWHGVNKTHWECFETCIISKSTEHHLESHLQDLEHMNVLQISDNGNSLQEAIDSI